MDSMGRIDTHSSSKSEGIIPEPFWEGRERQKQSLCYCVQCSQSSAFLWLLYHLIKTIECLLSATCLFLVHFECHRCFLVLFTLLCKFLFILLHRLSWPPSIPHSKSFLLSWPLQPESMPLIFSGGTTMNSFQTNLLVSWLGKHPPPTTLSLQESVRYIRFFLKLLIQLPEKTFFCNWNITHIS